MVEAPQRETTCSRPNVVAAAEVYRNLHAVRRWQAHVLRLEGEEGGEGGKGKKEEEGVVIGREEQATPPASPGHAPAALHNDNDDNGDDDEEKEEAKRRRDRAAVVAALSRPGAILSLQLSARYPGWVHYCRHASLTVRFLRDE